MAILKIAKMGHPVLHQVAEKVEDPSSPEAVAIAEDMLMFFRMVRIWSLRMAILCAGICTRMGDLVTFHCTYRIVRLRASCILSVAALKPSMSYTTRPTPERPLSA